MIPLVKKVVNLEVTITKKCIQSSVLGTCFGSLGISRAHLGITSLGRSYTLASGVPRGGWGVQTAPSPEILTALQNRAKFNPIVKTVKNC